MADIFDFPQGVRDVAYDDDKGPCMDDDARHSTLFRPHGVPDRVWDAVLSVERMPRLQGMAYHEIPVPNSMANFGIGVELECDDGYPSGWIMVLYSLKFQEDWHSHWRCVAFASLPMPEKESKRMEPGMYWESMMRFLDPDDSEHVSGTVTVAHNTAFGHDPDAPMAGCEVRVSWTPLDYADGGLDAGSQVGRWAAFLRSMTQSEEDVSVDR